MLIYPGVAPLDVAGPLQVFGFTNFLMKQQVYDIVTVAPTSGSGEDGGLASRSFPPARWRTCRSDRYIAGVRRPRAGTCQGAAISTGSRQTAPTARRFGSICTGAFMLDDAGLIDGKRVTTHWALAPNSHGAIRACKVDLDSIFVRDGNVYSSAGISAGIDLGLALLEEDHGRDLALTVARYLVLFLKRSGGQSQFSTQLQAHSHRVPPSSRSRLVP